MTRNAEAGPSRLALEPLPSRRPRRRTAIALRRRNVALLGAVGLAGACYVTGVQAQTQPVVARWGQASALVDGTFLVHGGRTQGVNGGGYTYGSGPNSADLLALDVTRGFDPSAAPWETISSTGQPPAVSFHSLSSLGEGRLLVFGGDGAPDVPVQTGNDSAYSLALSGSGSERSATWTRVTDAGQPMRRIYHAAESDGSGKVWFSGGMRDDGSNMLLDEAWCSDPAFTALQPPSSSLAGATATLLSDGTILMLGGLDSAGSLHGLANVTTFSTKDQTWSNVVIQGANSTAAGTPAPRRGHVAVSLPDKRVFIQGGASADLTTVYGDAWLLDWSVSPPRWTELTGDGGPGARFGHSAVAYGRQVLIAFGWTGTAAASTSVAVFNGMELQQQGSDSSWQGGSWSSTYKPDPSAGKTSGGGGSGSSSGGGSSGGGGSSSGSPSQPSATFGAPTSSAKPSDKPKDEGTSGGATAGAVIGAFVGLGLVAGAGYMLYRRHETSPDAWRRGDGADQLLGGPGGVAGQGMSFYHSEMLEKGAMAAGVGAAGAAAGFAAVRPNMRPPGPRSLGANAGKAWTAGNVGHAGEGSRPALRARLAMLTGIGMGSQATPHRFDMLADEDEEDATAYVMQDRGAPIYRASALDDEEMDEEGMDLGHRIRERSYGRLEQDDLDAEERAYAEGFETSPFEDDASPYEGYGRTAAGLGVAGAAGAYLAARRSHDDDDGASSDVNSSDGRGADGTGSGPSQQSHGAHSGASGYTPNSARSSDVGTAGIVSFSDADYGKRRSGAPSGPRSSAGASSTMKRSSTWWDRFMGQGFLERSASGRIVHGPRADEPIRDPARPPSLSAITESPRSANPSEDAAFGGPQAYEHDEMGRLPPGSGYPADSGHGRSLSSLRTATSSHLERQMANMDVVQRTRTASSRRTQSTLQTRSSSGDYDYGYGSEVSSMHMGPPSRMHSVRRNEAEHTPQLHQQHTALSPEGEVIWQPEDWHSTALPAMVREEEDAADQSVDIADQQREGAAGSVEADGALNDFSPSVALRKVQLGERDPASSDNPFEPRKKARGPRGSLGVREASETPSLTPATTKKARANPALTSPLRAAPERRTEPPVVGTVKERIKAIERKATRDELLPIPGSPVPTSAASASAGESVSSRSHSPVDERERETQRERGISPATSLGPSATSSATKTKASVVSVGLVQKPKLFIANPDRSGSECS